MNDSTFLTRVVLENYKSIARCDVRLGPLMFLVGKNGSGKSNFLDALRFVSEALDTSLGHAMDARGGLRDVIRRSSPQPESFRIALEFRLPDGSDGSYAFRIGAKGEHGFEVLEEECHFTRHLRPDQKNLTMNGGQASKDFAYKVALGIPRKTSTNVPAFETSSDRLYLVHASYVPDLRPAYDALRQMAFYNFNPAQMRDLRPHSPTEQLLPDGGNLASLFRRLEREQPELKARLQEYMALIVPGLCEVRSQGFGPAEAIEFLQRAKPGEEPTLFYASNMSDGSLRALGILVALFQSSEGSIRLTGIEEPEMALHPGASGALLGILRNGSVWTQVVVTTHSPDLLEDKDVPAECILPVNWEDGTTTIAGVDEVGRGVIRDRLYTVGELLRLDQLRPDADRAHLGESAEMTLSGSRS